MVNVIAEWLKLLPDKSLPSLEVRTELLKVLELFPTLDHQILRSSGIGKVVMMLRKHPKETKDNQNRARRLINEWARPIFNLPSDYRSITKEERMQSDYERMPPTKRGRPSSDMEETFVKLTEETDGDETKKPLKPGDKGWISRARVPRPEMKDYVIRPKWNVEAQFQKLNSKNSKTLLERKVQEIRQRIRPKKALHAITFPQKSRILDF
ncbi:unnamed protein product [Soboliphyme baturini]|uniref:TFIIS N-terminal domain-containing protein n=1 Tax=Soboliphyme baturini TaxID=241478 RepID=A0A183ILA0_9BILA|nr:unnamed protein product [Soboliphyme baturini]